LNPFGVSQPLFSSCFMVVDCPWPGRTVVLGGSFDNIFKEFFMSLGEE